MVNNMSLKHLDSGLKVVVGQFSTAGAKPVNEDAIGIRIPEGSALTAKGIVAVIADGVSGAEGGREASTTAVTGFLSDYYSTHDTWSGETSASKVIAALNRWLYGLGHSCLRPEQGYVTTFSAAVFKSASAYLFHVGDSRIARIRGGVLEPLTREHTTRVGNKQRYLARALGIDTMLDVDFHQLDLQRGDLFVLTTDGVHEWLTSQELVDILRPCLGHFQVGSLDPLCRVVAERARTNGSTDNLSVQLVKIANPGEPVAGDLLASVSKLPFPPPLAPGLKIDGWTVQRELHASSRSEVYLVADAHGRRAALKAPSANFQDDPAYIERFILEEWVGSRINSNHVVRVLRPSEGRTFLYYLTEYVAGPTLGQLLRERTRLSVVDAQNIITQVISGLRAFHRRDVLHQDIKPDNIVYSDDGIRIIDFGSCHSAGIGEIRSRLSREAKLGTRHYSAPEYLLDAPVSAASDQFSLGVLLYELLTGRHPFGDGYGKCLTEADFARLGYTPAYQLNPLVPVWLDGAIQRALSVDPARRYPALSEFAQDIQKPNPAYDGRRVGSAATDVLLPWKLAVILLLVINLLTLLLLT